MRPALRTEVHWHRVQHERNNPVLLSVQLFFEMTLRRTVKSVRIVVLLQQIFVNE